MFYGVLDYELDAGVVSGIDRDGSGNVEVISWTTVVMVEDGELGSGGIKVEE